MTKRTIRIVLSALAAAAVAAAAVYFGLLGRFTSPPPHDDVKNNPGDKTTADDEAADPSAYRPAPVSLASASSFLFTGKPPRQAALVKRPLQRRRAAVLRGRVLMRDGDPLAGVEVSVPAQSEVGRTRSGDDGGFDLAVNGGGPVVVAYEKAGFLPARRQVAAPWEDYAWLPDVVLVPTGARAGVLDLSEQAPGAETAQVLRGEATMDDDGPGQATFLAPPGFTAFLSFSAGDRPMKRLTLLVREYSVGPRGPSALPAAPPPGGGYAYAVEVAAEEEREPGAFGVRFSKNLIHYVENFLKLPVGMELPTVPLDPEASVWVPGPPGRVVRADGAAGAGAEKAEQEALAKLYAPDQTLWRLPLTGTGAWAVFLPLRPPDGAAAPPWPPATVPADDPAAPRPQPAVASVPLPGSDFLLHYGSDRAPGTKAPFHMDIVLSGAETPGRGGVTPPLLKRIDLEILIAGRQVKKTFTAQPGQKTTFPWDWNGLDAYGRPVAGRRPATVRVGYVYDAVPPARQEYILWREQRVLLGGWDARAAALGGWTLNVHHAYDPIGRVLYLGGGGRREGANLPPIVTTVAGGTGVLTYNDDDEAAVLANLSQPRGLAVGPDGSLYIADAGQHRVRRVGPDGLIATVAGTGQPGFSRDEGSGVETPLNGPTGLAFGPDGSLYIADDGNDGVRRLRPGGGLTLFAGRGGKYAYSGDGGPAVAAQLSLLRGLAVGPGGDVYIAQNGSEQCVRRVGPDGMVTCFLGGPKGKPYLRTANAVAVAPDGTVYAADGEGGRVWRVGTDGSATVVAGTDKPGFNGDGPAVKAQLNTPSGLAVAPDGVLYIADAGNQRVRRLGPDGVLTTVAGRGRSDSRDTGDGGDALQAVLKLSEKSEQGQGRLCGLAVGPDGGVYIADVGHGSVRRVAPAFGGISDSEILLTSEDGTELYVFDGVGRHLKTLDAVTGAVRYRFVYDAAWRLTEVHDGSDKVTKIERDKAGRPKAIVAPGGERTTLETGAEGRLSRVAFPAGEAAEMQYDAGGLLTSFTDAAGNVAHFRYGDDGRLVKEEGGVESR